MLLGALWTWTCSLHHYMMNMSLYHYNLKIRCHQPHFSDRQKLRQRRLRELPKIPKAVSGRARNQTQEPWPQSLWFCAASLYHGDGIKWKNWFMLKLSALKMDCYHCACWFLHGTVFLCKHFEFRFCSECLVKGLSVSFSAHIGETWA